MVKQIGFIITTNIFTSKIFLDIMDYSMKRGIRYLHYIIYIDNKLNISNKCFGV